MRKPVDDDKRKAFLADIVEVCRKHGLVLIHEDYQGAFLVSPIDEQAIRALERAWPDDGR